MNSDKEKKEYKTPSIQLQLTRAVKHLKDEDAEIVMEIVSRFLEDELR